MILGRDQIHNNTHVLELGGKSIRRSIGRVAGFSCVINDLLVLRATNTFILVYVRPTIYRER
jgi:hypothetical protein